MFVLLFSCGGNSEKNESEAPAKKPLSLSTQEGMMEALKECNIEIPEKLKFVEITKSGDEYSALFQADNVDETAKNEFDNWFKTQLETLISAGWRPFEIRKDETMAGILFNEKIMLKPAGIKSRIDKGITFTTAYDADKATYKIYIRTS